MSEPQLKIRETKATTEDGHPVFTAESANGSCFASFSISIPKSMAEKYPMRLAIMEAACVKALKLALHRVYFPPEPEKPSDETPTLEAKPDSPVLPEEPKPSDPAIGASEGSVAGGDKSVEESKQP